MKKLVSFVAATALVAALITTSSCTKTCDAGYEGADCKTLKTAKFVGTFAGSDICTSGTYAITFVTSTTSSNIVGVSISNFGGFGATVYISGTVDSTNSSKVNLVNQSLGGNRTLTGSITISGSSVLTNYTVTPASGTPDNCSGTFTKQ